MKNESKCGESTKLILNIQNQYKCLLVQMFYLHFFILRMIIVRNVNCIWNYLVIELQHPMCRRKYEHLCCCSSYSCSAAFPIYRMGNMQANLAPVNEKYLVFNECCLYIFSYFVHLGISGFIARFLNLKKHPNPTTS